MISTKSISKNRRNARNLKGRLPDFIIAGVYRSGTTSLFVNLSKHPQIEMTPRANAQIGSGKLQNEKEIHFFNERWSNGVAWYQGLFNDNDKLQGEAASKYLFEEEYIQRMVSIVPDAKIIVTLRNPVDRAFSQYEFLKKPYPGLEIRLKKNREEILTMAKFRSISFDQMVRQELKKEIRVGQGLVGKGLYADMIEMLWKYYPKKQVHIMVNEWMKRDMPGTYRRLFDFLSVPSVNIDFEMDVNVSRYERLMSQETKDHLNKIYRSHNERLFELLGQDIPQWEA